MSFTRLKSNQDSLFKVELIQFSYVLLVFSLLILKLISVFTYDLNNRTLDKSVQNFSNV